VVGHVEGVETVRHIGRERIAARDTSSGPASFSWSATCHSPVSTRLISRPGASASGPVMASAPLRGRITFPSPAGRRCRDTVRTSGKIPCGRQSSIRAQHHADDHDLQRGRPRLLARRKHLGLDRRRGGAQIAQTSTAPRIAPRLLPEPPTISIAQTWKVSIGSSFRAR
jgi:hypothetical protein